VIRFSAALVAVAIGVLIGGIATSELLLVYIAIVVSAAALVVLTIGIVLKREELFGEGQGLVPAGAGASPVLPVRTGASHDQVLSSAHVASPPPPSQGAVGGYAALFGGTAPAVPAAVAPLAAADLTATRPAAAGQGRAADRVPPWATPVAREPWSSSAQDTRPPWMPAGQEERTTTGAGGAGSRAPSAWQNRTPGAALSGWAVPDADAQAAATAPKSWAAPSSGSPDAPSVKPSAGSGSKPPSWFDRLGKPAAPEAPAATSASAPGAGRGWSTSSQDTAVPEEAVPEATVPENTGGPARSADATAVGNDGDDWPTRYSWLDDETGASGEAEDADVTVTADRSGAGRESKPPVLLEASTEAGTEDTAAPDVSDADTTMLADPGNATEPSLTSDPAPEAEVEVEVEVEAASEPGGGGEPGAGSQPPAQASADDAPGTSLVTVVPGVPRYHDPDCVLIRFMSEDDIKKLSIPQAREAGCTPCGACQPEG
jgi:hypothetical protein